MNFVFQYTLVNNSRASYKMLLVLHTVAIMALSSSGGNQLRVGEDSVRA